MTFLISLIVQQILKCLGQLRFMCLLSFAGQHCCVIFYNLFSRSKIMEKSQKRLSISAGEKSPGSIRAKARSLHASMQSMETASHEKRAIHFAFFRRTNTPLSTQTNALY
jgi:hypothetical protein